MHKQKWLLLFINLLGGSAVIGSYIWGFRAFPDAGQILWGGVPLAIRPYYTAGMILAANGFFAFTYFILFQLKVEETRVFYRFGYGAFNIIYAIILVFSALWMPWTFAALQGSTLGLLWAVRLVLAIVALASLALIAALLTVQPRRPVRAHRLALVGCVGFCLQTVLLDAIVWSSYFTV
jgi:hypothetical protein